MSYGMFGPVDPDLVSRETEEERFCEEDGWEIYPEELERVEET